MNTLRVEQELPDGSTRTLRDEALDPLDRLWTPGDHPHSQVGFSIGTQHDFGRIKVTAHVHYECDQKTAVVNEAAVMAFTKATESMTDAMKTLLGEEGAAS